MPKKTAVLLGAAPNWAPPLSEFEILWHGCTAFAKDTIESSGIDLTRCAVDTDFGRGFYTTTLERQAKLWAWDRFSEWRTHNPRAKGNRPVIVRFQVRRFTASPWTSPLDDGLDKLLSLHFVRGEYDNESFWSFVQHCRLSTRSDPVAGIAEVVHDHKRPATGWYQLVSGPVAAFWKQRVAMSGADQFSFHIGGTALLDALINQGKGKGPDGRGDPDFYEWTIVT